MIMTFETCAQKNPTRKRICWRHTVIAVAAVDRELLRHVWDSYKCQFNRGWGSYGQTTIYNMRFASVFKGVYKVCLRCLHWACDQQRSFSSGDFVPMPPIGVCPYSQYGPTSFPWALDFGPYTSAYNKALFRAFLFNNSISSKLFHVNIHITVIGESGFVFYSSYPSLHF